MHLVAVELQQMETDVVNFSIRFQPLPVLHVLRQGWGCISKVSRGEGLFVFLQGVGNGGYSTAVVPEDEKTTMKELMLTQALSQIIMRQSHSVPLL